MATQLHVCEQLSFMDREDSFRRFDLDDDSSADRQIDPETCIDMLVTVMERHGHLTNR